MDTLTSHHGYLYLSPWILLPLIMDTTVQRNGLEMCATLFLMYVMSTHPLTECGFCLPYAMTVAPVGLFWGSSFVSLDQWMPKVLLLSLR